MRSHVFTCLLLGLLTLTVYAQTVTFDFVSLDDPQWVTQNPFVATGVRLENVRWAFDGRSMQSLSNWTPLTFLSLMLDAELFGLRAGGFHLVNVGLHCLNAWFLYAALYCMTGQRWNCGLVAALFAVHPLHVESVAWVTERKDVLSQCWGLAALWSYARYATSRRFRIYMLTVLLFALSLMSKQTFVTLPCLLLLLDYWPLDRWRTTANDIEPQAVATTAASSVRSNWRMLLVEKLPFLGLSVAFSILAIRSQTDALAHPSHWSLVARVQHAASAYVEYLTKTFWPAGHSVYYAFQKVDQTSWPWRAILLLLTLSGTAVALARRAPWVFTGWFWFLGTFVPMIGLVQVGMQRIADRYTYFPLIGIYILVVWSLFAAMQFRPGWSRSLRWAATFVVAALVVLSARQAACWRNSQTLYESGLAAERESGRLHQLLALEEFNAGAPETAFARFATAARLEPSDYTLFADWGECLRRAGRLEAAKEKLQTSLDLRPNYAPTLHFLAMVYEQQGAVELAMQTYRQALRSNPGHPQANYNLGNLLVQAGNLEAAAKHYQAAIANDPQFAQAYNNLGVVYYSQGQPQRAVEQFESALQIDPSLEQARQALNSLRGVVEQEQ
ncbi:MAG: tetratricopeptide repeat protein [Planctomycetaceae bacterium]|nr:tetratricopeptide repeat protein [Planctomycetaceae bacterium]